MKQVIEEGQIGCVVPLHRELKVGTLNGLLKQETVGEKCDRCWNYSEQVGKIEAHPLICERCVEALQKHF